MLFYLSFGLLLVRAVALGFNGHLVTEGPLTLEIAEIPVVRVFYEPQPCTITLTNSGAAELEVTLAMSGLVDDCRALGEIRQRVTVSAQRKTTATFQFACGRKTHSAHYPIHIRATFAAEGTSRTAHAVRIFETDFGAVVAAQPAPSKLPVTRVSARGALALTTFKTQGVAWSYTAGPLVQLPVGWTGSDATSSATFSRGPMTRGGVTRPALQMHPPYRPGAGTVFAEYRLQLPATTPIRAEFFNAIRDSTPREGASDGVTFRVWVDGQKVFERHTDTKSWIPGDADLSAWAGKEILLRLESHPGPKNNTVCDSSYWGDPIIAVGSRPRTITGDERAALLARARVMLGSGQPGGTALVFELDGGCRAVVAPGPNGLGDGAIGFGDGEKQVLFAGLHMAVSEHVVGVWPSGAVVEGVDISRDAAGRTRMSHRLHVNGQSVELIATIWKDGPALRIKVDCPEPITGLGLNAADQKAPRV